MANLLLGLHMLTLGYLGVRVSEGEGVVRLTCCSASMRESSLSCRARSELASSPCSEPTPLLLAGAWLGWLGWLGRGWLAYGSWQAGSWAAELPRMPSGGRGGVCGPATGARDRWDPDLVPRGDMASAQPRRARDAEPSQSALLQTNNLNNMCCRLTKQRPRR